MTTLLWLLCGHLVVEGGYMPKPRNRPEGMPDVIILLN